MEHVYVTPDYAQCFFSIKIKKKVPEHCFGGDLLKREKKKKCIPVYTGGFPTLDYYEVTNMSHYQMTISQNFETVNLN